MEDTTEETSISYEGDDESIFRRNDTGSETALETQVLELLSDSYTTQEERMTAGERLIDLDKQLKDYATRFLPNGIVPIMVTPAQQDNQVDSQYGSATWSEYSSQGDFAGVDDNYCRQMESGDWFYPRRNNNQADSGDAVELGSCSTLMNDDVLLTSNITDKIDQLITRAKLEFIKSDTSSDDPSNQSKNTIMKMVQDYENLHRQYLQMVRNVNTNTDILKRRTQTISEDSDTMDEKQNKIDIQNDIFNDWMDVEDKNTTRNNDLIKWSKWLLWILWVLMVGIILLANTKFIVQN